MTMLLQQCWVRVLGSHRPRLIVFYCMFQTFLLIHCQCVRDHCDAKKLITQLPGGYTVDHNLTVPLHIHNLINFDKIPKTSGWNEKPKTSLLIFDKHIDSLYLKIEWIPPSDLLPPIFSYIFVKCWSTSAFFPCLPSWKMASPHPPFYWDYFYWQFFEH